MIRAGESSSTESSQVNQKNSHATLLTLHLAIEVTLVTFPRSRGFGHIDDDPLHPANLLRHILPHFIPEVVPFLLFVSLFEDVIFQEAYFIEKTFQSFEIDLNKF